MSNDIDFRFTVEVFPSIWYEELHDKQIRTRCGNEASVNTWNSLLLVISCAQKEQSQSTLTPREYTEATERCLTHGEDNGATCFPTCACCLFPSRRLCSPSTNTKLVSLNSVQQETQLDRNTECANIALFIFLN